MNTTFLPCGDTALCVQFGETIDRALCLAVVRLRDAIERAGVAGVVETVPTYRSLLVHYDPLQTSQHTLCEQLAELVEMKDVTDLRPKSWRLPICLDKSFASDLTELSEKLSISLPDLQQKICSTELFVYMTGFIMGLLYLGDFPFFKHISRRTNPRTRLASGSVAVAQGMAVIYPVTSPGGWNIIGNTPAPLFDIRNTPPSPFTPGDTICFYPVDRKEHSRIAALAAEGNFQLEWEEKR